MSKQKGETTAEVAKTLTRFLETTKEAAEMANNDKQLNREASFLVYDINANPAMGVPIAGLAYFCPYELR